MLAHISTDACHAYELKSAAPRFSSLKYRNIYWLYQLVLPLKLHVPGGSQLLLQKLH